ncbi:MAG TPA: carboxypeptidase-like regulatory domain-containing protein, partial [Bryobacteraceae bacterium]|nr:carboxypeptidase-like regulatory domain-containing protein [Bryobacteraceae bacterium]
MRVASTEAGGLAIAACLLLAAPLAPAQTDRGAITGTVADPSGAAVAHAAVSAANAATGAIFLTTTTRTGNYAIGQLPYGVYRLSVAARGFKKYIRENLRVEVAQAVRIDVSLDVGLVSDSISVSAESSLLRTDGGLSYGVTDETLDQLPILGIGAAAAGSSGIRNPSSLTLLLPGAYYEPNASLKLNGAPNNSERFNVEGMDASNQLMAYSPAQTQPSVDAIQEISIQTGNFNAEYGAAGGSFFNATMRSGGNQYHGGIYDYFANEILNAGEPFTGPPFTRTPPGELVRPRARRNDYGANLGGPASIPKLFDARNR